MQHVLLCCVQLLLLHVTNDYYMLCMLLDITKSYYMLPSVVACNLELLHVCVVRCHQQLLHAVQCC